ncbi:DUF1287 domain-containing protein [Pseudogemmobacter sp. CC-YST710]|uniref:DUF1287 domain-containing protein n=2 Tax=Pseudogemmobacter faecipullorum TaxID=2755041 RepID=A0ABS8CMF6_9RHOB|nr:DUF1287 domain-containing protein [Pseudogemmobacter faecipullorum]
MSAEPLSRRTLLAAPLLLLAPHLARGASETGADPGEALARAAAGQIGRVTIYDPAYIRLDFPGGDVAPERGVCTDVLIRALREAHGIDLQRAVNRDMKADFAAYPASWGLKRPDANIDHRRVPNLRRLFERLQADLPPGADPADFRPGDVVTCTLPGNLAHLMLVAQERSRDGNRPLILHNIGAGTRAEDRLNEFSMTGHYRLSPAVLEKLRRLDS